VEITMIKLERLTPYHRALRKNNRAVKRMMESIREYGFKIPILARKDGEVVDGHLRLKAATRLGLTEVPVIWCDEWNPAQVKAFRLMVNRSASWAEWDDSLLALELSELSAVDFDLDLTGFDPCEVDRLLIGSEQHDREQQLQPVAVSQRGELWLCGLHRVLCGDCTSAVDVNRAFSGFKPVLMNTDPPYGVEYDPQWRERAGLGDPRQTGAVRNDDQADWGEAFKLFAGNVAYVWHAGVHASTVAASLQTAGFRIRAQIIWYKQHFALSRGDFHWAHEPCWYAVREGKSSNWSGDRTQSTVWEVPNLNPFGGGGEEAATGHGTQKPIELMRRAVLNNSKRGEIVYDPFLGSGTTLIAAQVTDRICHGLEIEPKYVDMTVRRWQELTGEKAHLENDGRAFDEVAGERNVPGTERPPTPLPPPTPALP
jgi:DNA modification methylase